MKIIQFCFLLIAIYFSQCIKAQSLSFSYDSAGNQIIRQIVFGGKPSKNDKDTISAFQKFHLEDEFTYYPNPVKEVLYLKWQNLNEKEVTNIKLWDLNGRLLKEYENLNLFNDKEIPFENLPVGTYVLNIIFSNQEVKSIKIVKSN